MFVGGKTPPKLALIHTELVTSGRPAAWFSSHHTSRKASRITLILPPCPMAWKLSRESSDTIFRLTLFPLYLEITDLCCLVSSIQNTIFHIFCLFFLKLSVPLRLMDNFHLSYSVLAGSRSPSVFSFQKKSHLKDLRQTTSWEPSEERTHRHRYVCMYIHCLVGLPWWLSGENLSAMQETQI